MTKSFVAYYRVSTQRQGQSGLGLEAQRRQAKNYATQSGGLINEEFIEVESGRRKSRPTLERAIESCRSTGAHLLIAKLDRLARNVHFISGLLESKVTFVAADMPTADRFMLHVYAAMAEEEGRRISQRTRDALRSAKHRGQRLGEHAKEEHQKNSTRARNFALDIGPEIARLHESGHSFREISIELNVGATPPFRKGSWHPTSVYRTWRRYMSLTSGDTKPTPRAT
ncbi:recombinase family protein [Salipiger pacificus]|nr:recombinase family protein [Alloyangia pacifica]